MVEASTSEELLLTVSEERGVIKIERFGTDGKARELTLHDWTTLAGNHAFAELSAAVEKAYAAGLAVGLGEEDSDDDEVDEDLVRLRLLVDRPMLTRALVRRLLRRRGHPAQSPAQQRRKPIANGALNGSASTK